MIIKNVSQEFELQSVDLWEITENHSEYYIDAFHFNNLGAEAIVEKINDEIGSIILIFPPESLTTSSTSTPGFNFIIVLLQVVILTSGIPFRKKNNK